MSTATSLIINNIPPDTTEEALAERLRTAAGDFSQFKLLVDVTTGKAQGSALCEFPTYEAAQQAIRALNNSDLNGSKMRLEIVSSTFESLGFSSLSSKDSAGVKQLRDIETAIAQLSMNEIYDVVNEVRAWVARDPDGARDLLMQRPVVAHTLLKLQIKMGMLRTPPQVDSSFGGPSYPAPYAPPVSSAPAPLAPPPPPSLATALPPVAQLYAIPPPAFHPGIYAAPPPYAPQAYAYPQPSFPGPYIPAPAPYAADPRFYFHQRALMMNEQDIMRLPYAEQQAIRQIRLQAGRR